MYITYMYYLVCDILVRQGSLWRISPLPANTFKTVLTSADEIPHEKCGRSPAAFSVTSPAHAIFTTWMGHYMDYDAMEQFAS